MRISTPGVNKISIPEINTELVLALDWTFNLYFEHQNQKFGKVMGLDDGWCYDEPASLAMPAGTILRIDAFQRSTLGLLITFMAFSPPTSRAKDPKLLGRF